MLPLLLKSFLETITRMFSPLRLGEQGRCLGALVQQPLFGSQTTSNNPIAAQRVTKPLRL